MLSPPLSLYLFRSIRLCNTWHCEVVHGGGGDDDDDDDKNKNNNNNNNNNKNNNNNNNNNNINKNKNNKIISKAPKQATERDYDD